jgi:hypothetical protein
MPSGLVKMSAVMLHAKAQAYIGLPRVGNTGIGGDPAKARRHINEYITVILQDGNDIRKRLTVSTHSINFRVSVEDGTYTVSSVYKLETAQVGMSANVL